MLNLASMAVGVNDIPQESFINARENCDMNLCAEDIDFTSMTKNDKFQRY
jgi:hypothetical protein